MVVNNPWITSFNGHYLFKIFTTAYANIYVPLTALSFALEYYVFKLNPFYYHLDNLLLHISVVLLFFWLCLRLRLSHRAAFIGALLFAIHPLHVQSVAWVAERKDVLYAFCYLLAIHQYLSYTKTGRWGNYLLSIVCGLLSLLAKPMALSLPLILFLLDWLQDRRLTWRTVVEKIPYVTLAIQIAGITYLFHAHPANPDLLSAVLTGCWTFTFYLKAFLFPFVLLPIYRLPYPVSLLNPQFALAVSIFAIFLLSLWRFRRDRLWVFACGYYFLSIFFLLRFNAGADVYIVADRYMYLPSLGFCLFLGFQADRVLNLTREMSLGIRRMAVVLLVVLTVILSGKTFFLCQLWGDEGRLWGTVIRWAPQQALAYNNLGNYYHRRGDIVQALHYYNQALGYSSEFDPLVYRHIGNAYMAQKKYASAMDYYNRSLGARSPCLATYLDRGRLQARLGNAAEAFHDYEKAIEHDPELSLAYHERALLFYQQGDLKHAADDLSTAIEKAPNFLTAYYFRGQIYARLGRPDLARVDFETILKMDDGRWFARARERLNAVGTVPPIDKGLFIPTDTYERSIWEN